MGRAVRGMAAGGQAALAASCVTDRTVLERVRLALLAGMARVDPLSRHEQLGLPAENLERRTVTFLVNTHPARRP
jgi:hypothetical protein